jgi:4-hydroxy-2-oxoheptanedioate aldolase
MRTRAKERIASGAVVDLINPDYPSPGLVEFLGRSGVDALFIDCEHGSSGFERVEELARAARLTGMAAIVRPMTADSALMTRYLERGIDGLMVPHVDDAETANTVVETIRYTRWRDYEDVIFLAQVESVKAIDNLPELLAVEGIDVYFIGPSDLSQDMGHAGEFDHPEVEAQIQRARKSILDANSCAGILVNPETVARRVEEGFRVLYEHANTFIHRGVGTMRASAGLDKA